MLYQKYSIKENGNNVYYYEDSNDKIKKNVRKAILKTVDKCKKTLKSSFVDSISIHLASDFKNLDQHNFFSSYLKQYEEYFEEARGVGMAENTEVYMQQSAYEKFGFEKKIIRCDMMHEYGHKFDAFYGDHVDPEIKQKYLELSEKYEANQDYEYTEEDKIIEYKYFDTNEFSDTDVFRKALYEDFKNIDIAEVKQIFGYYTSMFVNDDNNKKPSMEDIDLGEASRCEVFAQSFAYAMGEDDGYKKKWMTMFKNTYEVVLDFINKNKK